MLALFFAASLANAAVVTTTVKAASLHLEPAVHDKVPFVRYGGGGEFANYLAMNISYPPVKSVFDQMHLNLKTRGEAHITTVTPVEFWKQLKPLGIKIEDINKIAVDNHIQDAKFDTVCVGAGHAKIDGKDEATYFIVVTSDDLVNIRREIEKFAASKGATDFKADHFYPHITLGFTKRDLHEEDGVIKNANSCVYDLTTAK